MDRERLGYDHDSERYNIAEDPDELTNVADQHPDVVADLSTKIDAYLGSGKDLTTVQFHALEDFAPPNERETLEPESGTCS